MFLLLLLPNVKLLFNAYSTHSQDADKSAMSPEEVTLTFDSLPDVARQSARGQHEPQDDDDMDVNEADDNSGATRRRAPGMLQLKALGTFSLLTWCIPT